MKQLHVLYLTALLAGLQTAQTLPDALPTLPVANEPQFRQESSLAIRQDTSVQLYRRQLNPDDMTKLLEQCNIFADNVVGKISAIPGWFWQALAKAAIPPLTAHGACVQAGFQNCHGSAEVGVALGLAVMLHDINSGDKSTEQGAEPAQPKGKARRRRRQLESRRLRGRMAAYLASRGVAFESISEVASSSSHLAARLVDQGGYSLDIRGVAQTEGGPVVDHRLTVSGDGTGHVLVMPRASASTLSGTSDTRLSERAGAGGFKITYKVINPGDTSVEPDPKGVDWVTQQMAADWANRAEDDQSMGDYVGALGMGESETTVQVRIIPESGGFNENYEDVNHCNAK